MIYCLTGKIIKKTLDSVVISCGGVGYFVQIPATTGEALPPAGKEGTVYTIMNVTENDVSLYGFATEEQRDCFKMLTAVTGVGPKAGLAILSIMTPEKIALAASSGDHKAFTKAAGVGPKLAQRITLELKDKVIITAGNHDSASRLEAPQIGRARAHLRTGAGRGRTGQPWVRRLRCSRCRGPGGRDPLGAGDHHDCAAQPVAHLKGRGVLELESGIHR